MAEAIALGASVIAFIQLADRVICVAKYYIEAINDCPRDIRAILVEICSLKAVLENLDFLLHNDSGPEPYLMQQLTGEFGPMEGCRKSVAELERLLPLDLSTVRGKRQKILTAADYLAWPLRETTAKKLIDNISRYKASMAFALTYDSMRDIKDLRKDLRQVKETLTHAERNEVCTWLESTNPSSNHNSAWKLHEDHTGVWMIRSTEWQEWLDGQIKFLWIHGIPGAGKTVLASLLVEQAQAACNEQNSIPGPPNPLVCVYYYCYFGRNQDEAAPFLRWLVSQLCRQARLIPNEVDRLFQLKHVPSISQLLNALQLLLEEYGAVLVIIDAVDESQSRQDLLKVLRDLATDHRFDKVRLLATSREYYDIEMCFSSISSQISMMNPVVEDDIRRYAHSALISNRRFHSWPRALVTEVENALAKGAKGMFRWAVCQIDVLQRLKRQEDVRIAIANLPKTLDETYERIFQLLPEEDHQFVQLALIFICGNNDVRPMPIPANVLLRAIIFRLESIFDNDPDGVSFYNRDILRDRCGCLISFSTYDDTEYVALAHYTVKEFLHSDRTASGRLSQFALSETLVQTTFFRTVLEVTTKRIYASQAPSIDSFESYCILATERNMTRHDWSSKIWGRDAEVLTETYKVLAGSSAYIAELVKVLRLEREAAAKYNCAAGLEASRT